MSDTRNDRITTTNAHSAHSGTRGHLAGWTLVNACILGASAWLLFSQGNTMVSRADAAPPPSSRNIDNAATQAANSQALDSGEQRLELIREIRGLRTEVGELKALLISGRMQTEIANADEIKLEIDYAKLRDAMRGQ